MHMPNELHMLLAHKNFVKKKSRVCAKQAGSNYNTLELISGGASIESRARDRPLALILPWFSSVSPVKLLGRYPELNAVSFYLSSPSG